VVVAFDQGLKYKLVRGVTGVLFKEKHTNITNNRKKANNVKNVKKK